VSVLVADLNDEATLEAVRSSLQVEGAPAVSLASLSEAWNQASSQPVLSSVSMFL
jgi:hypothetical protein